MQPWFDIVYGLDDMTGFHSEILSKAECKQLLRQQHQLFLTTDRHLLTTFYSRILVYLGDALVNLGSRLQTRATTFTMAAMAQQPDIERTN